MDRDEKTVEHYIHIDNGGYTISGDRFGNVEIKFGFHGYSETKICITNGNYDRKGSVLDQIILALTNIRGNLDID